MKTFSKKLEYSFVVDSNMVEKVLFPYKTALSKANVKTNKKWGAQTGPFTKNTVLPVTILLFHLKVLFPCQYP